MNVFHLNAIFTYLFIFWCFSVVFTLSNFPKDFLEPCKGWVQGFYLIVAFLVYRNIWAYEYEKYAKRCLPIAIAGYALVSVVQILACFYYATYLGYRYSPDHKGETMLILLIPALPLGFFGFAISFYCNLKIRVPYISYKRVEYFSLFPIYATLALLLSSYILYFVANQPDVVFKHDVMSTHASIVIGSILIIIGFITFRKEAFFVAFLALVFAAFSYIKIIGKMTFYGIQEIHFKNFKADYYFVLFHIITILVFIVIGMIMCFYVNGRPRIQEKSLSKHKIFVLNKEAMPFTVSQKC